MKMRIRFYFVSYHCYNRLYISATSPVVLSTLENGMVVRGLAGFPSEGPTLLVGYHMLLGLEQAPLVIRMLAEKNIVVQGIAHPMMFYRSKERKLPDLSEYDMFRLMGATPVSGTNLFKLLASKSHVLLYPGGMREALHRKVCVALYYAFLPFSSCKRICIWPFRKQ